jgi:hypothetical protein
VLILVAALSLSDDPMGITTAVHNRPAAKGAQKIAVGLMRGLGFTKVGFQPSLIGYWAIGVPKMLLAGQLRLAWAVLDSARRPTNRARSCFFFFSPTHWRHTNFKLWFLVISSNTNE